MSWSRVVWVWGGRRLVCPRVKVVMRAHAAFEMEAAIATRGFRTYEHNVHLGGWYFFDII